MKNHIYNQKTLAPEKSWIMVVCFLLLTTFGVLKINAQTCNYKVGTVTMSLSGQTTGANISSQLVLTNPNGIIQYVSSPNNLTISNVAANTYNAVAVTYNNGNAPNLSVGSDINLVSFCNKSTAVSIGVCDCNNSTGVFAVAQSGQTAKSGQINKYVLTNGKGIILAISDTPTFSGYGNGIYNVYGVSYAGIVNNLVKDGLISSVNGSCVDITKGVGYVVCVPELSIDKAGPAVAEKGVNFNYTLTVSNSGTIASSGTITVKDTLATGLSFISGGGNGWACTASTISLGQQVVTCSSTLAIAPTASYPINLTVVSSLTGTVKNKAWVNGGGDITPNLPSKEITTVINESTKPNLVISKAGPSSATVGVNFDYTLTVSNNGTTGTSGIITVSDNLPTSVAFVSGSGTGWSCTASGQLVTCTTANQIAVNGSNNIILTVTPISATLVGSPAKNIATVTGGGNPNPNPVPSPAVETIINPTPKPALAVIKAGPASATVGVNYNYTITVSNTGNTFTSGAITVTDNLASNLQFISGSGTGWTCAASGQLVTCMSSTSIPVGSSSVITLTVKPTDAASGTTIKNIAYVTGGGSASPNPVPSQEVTTVVSPAPTPNLVITKNGPSTGTINVNYDYVLAVSNNGNVATNGIITVKDNLPNGLTFVSGGGTGWACSAVGQLVTCTSSSVLGVNASSAITLTVKPTQFGTYTNIATAEGGGDPTPKTSPSVITTISQPSTPNLVLTKTGPVTAKVGTNFDYGLTINNTGLIPTSGVITVTDNISSNLQIVSAIGAGWSCTITGQVISCTSSNIIPANGNNLITVTVKPITPTPLGSPIKNTGYVIGGGDVSTTPKPSNEVQTEITDVPKDNVSIAKEAPSTGTVGTNYNYTLTITNGGTIATSGIITVTDNLQSGLQFVSGSGSGFTCSALGQSITCTNNGATQIPVGQNVVISIVVKPTINGLFKNVASVTAGGITKPSNETNTNVNCSTDINPGTLGF
jgi:uncharacterized repeat protein (TIGR01451 family)